MVTGVRSPIRCLPNQTRRGKGRWGRFCWSGRAACSTLAPLHNPANLAGIAAARSRFGDLVHVAVFDTAFHQTLPPAAYLYAIPYELYEQLRVRRYGFHGSSQLKFLPRPKHLSLANWGRSPAQLNTHNAIGVQ